MPAEYDSAEFSQFDFQSTSHQRSRDRHQVDEAAGDAAHFGKHQARQRKGEVRFQGLLAVPDANASSARRAGRWRGAIEIPAPASSPAGGVPGEIPSNRGDASTRRIHSLNGSPQGFLRKSRWTETVAQQVRTTDSGAAKSKVPGSRADQIPAPCRGTRRAGQGRSRTRPDQALHLRGFLSGLLLGDAAHQGR